MCQFDHTKFGGDVLTLTKEDAAESGKVPRKGNL